MLDEVQERQQTIDRRSLSLGSAVAAGRRRAHDRGRLGGSATLALAVTAGPGGGAVGTGSGRSRDGRAGATSGPVSTPGEWTDWRP